MSSCKVEPVDEDDYEVYFHYKICDIMRQDFTKLEESDDMDQLHLKLYINQSEMKFLGKILFKNNVSFYLQDSPVSFITSRCHFLLVAKLKIRAR